MRITLAAIGKAKDSPEKNVFAQYVKRLPWKITLKECDVKKNLPEAARIAEEGKLLLGALESADIIIALDENGKNMKSLEFAQWVQRQQNKSVQHMGFCIGGADGHSETVLRKAHLSLSFGAATWPHMLVRGMLAEQLYRAYSILTHHPYHRE
jgi:23S rRNA (pseudouridine1915-N3)-methyltransferase